VRPKLGSLEWKPHLLLEGFSVARGDGFSIVRANTADASRWMLGRRYEVYEYDKETYQRFENMKQVREHLGPITRGG
jgi:hypothetical protein